MDCELRNEKLKILHIPAWYPSDKNPVAGTFIKEHIKAISLFNEVAIVYCEGIKKGIKGIIQQEDMIEEGIRTIRLHYIKSPIPKTTFLIYYIALIRAFRILRKDDFKPDIIHAHVFTAGLPALFLGYLYKIPVIITEHSTAFERKQIAGAALLKARLAFRKSMVVCPVSEGLKESIRKLGIRANFIVIPNTVDTTLFSPPSYKNNRKNNKKRILLVALIDPKKGIPYLLDALASLKKIREDFLLEIVGDGPYRVEYEGLVRKLNMENHVYFHGIKTKKEVADYMKNCNFFVLPSIYETFGVVLIEALACGKPVIATDVTGPKEIVNESVGLLIPPADSETLARAINYMLDHYMDYNPIEISDYAKKRYSYESVGKSYDNIYRLVKCKPAAFWIRVLRKLLKPFYWRNWNIAQRIELWSKAFKKLKGISRRDQIFFHINAILDISWCLIHYKTRRNPKGLFPCTLYCKELKTKYQTRGSSDDIYFIMPFREGEVHEAISNLIEEGDVFIDVGSNVGYYALLASKKVGEKGQVIAIEAHPFTVKQLLKNIESNSKTNIKVINAAAWSETGKSVSIKNEKGRFGEAHIDECTQRGFRNEEATMAKTIRLDDICVGFEHIKLIKMDIEGAEYKALLGAKETLRRTDYIILELSKDEGEIVMLLSQMGFTLRKLNFSSYIIAENILKR